MLRLKDFNGLKIEKEWTSFDYLLMVTEVASCKLIHKSKRKCHNMGNESGSSWNGIYEKEKTNESKRFKKSIHALQHTSNKKVKIYPSYSSPDLPMEFKDLIITILRGSEIELVIQKTLYPTDVARNNNRLSIPAKQASIKFLSEKEERILEESPTTGLQVSLIDPLLMESTITLKRWNMKKENKKTCCQYVLCKQWNDVVKNNDLQANDVVQVWSFRVDSNLSFAIVRTVSARKENEIGDNQG